MQLKFKALVVFFVLLISASTMASIELLEPKNLILDEGVDVSVGRMEPGQQINLTFYKKIQGFDWQEIKVNESVFPKSWSYRITDRKQNFEVQILVPLEEKERIQRIEINALSGSIKESFGVKLEIRNNLNDLSLNETSKIVDLGSSSEYNLITLNESIANQTMIIESNLPTNWFTPRQITVAPKKESSIPLNVSPLIYGKKDFVFSIYKLSNNNEKILMKKLNAQITATPSLKGKFNAVKAGVPFYSIQLFPVMLFDYFLSSFT